jgi:hypothetical protein
LAQYEESLIKKTLVKAMEGEGDPRLLQWFLNYFTQFGSINLGLSKTSTMEGLSRGQERLIKTVASGRVSAKTAKQIDDLITSHAQMIEARDLERRIGLLEEKQQGREQLEN